jgi:predicted TIM-barrel fold metal-dependent hydrolase
MKIIDTHQHLWDLDLFHYAWLGNLPGLNRSFRMDDYRVATSGLDIAKSIHLEADVDQEFMLAETRHILQLADQPDNVLEGVVACARPENKDFQSYLDKIAGHPKLKGIRRILHTQPDELGQGETFIRNVGTLAERGLSFDICVLQRQMPIAIRLVSRCPAVQFVLDHCGVPLVKERQFEPWRTHIREIAKFPNVVCKISGIVAYAEPQNWTADHLRPYVEHVLECFGWDRVMFGSDWPVCTLSATYHQWVNGLLAITRGSDESNQRKLFYGNAERVYRLT